MLSSQQAAKRTADKGAANRTAYRAAYRFTEVGDGPADNLVGDRTRDAPRDHLTGRHLAAPYAGSENRTDDRTDLPENSAATRGRRGSGHALLQHLISGFGIDRGVVFALHRAHVHDRLAFLRRDRSDPRRRRPYHDALDHRRGTVTLQERNQCFALAQFHDDLGGVELRIGPERLRRRRDSFLVTRGESPQGMLYAVAQLAEHLVRDVDRILRHEIDANAFRADQPHDLLDFIHQRLGRIVEQQMRLVEEEHEL